MIVIVTLLLFYCYKAFSSATDFESPDHDGKWAEEESDASSVDEFDSVSNKGTRRQDFEARKALALEERKSQQESDSVKGRLTKSANDGESKKTHAVKAKTSSSAKGVKKGKIRFKDGGKSPDNQKPGTERKKMAKKGKEVEKNEEKKEDESDVSEPKEEKRNKYLDEWLGIKREEEDPRYKPGKPPPNRLICGQEQMFSFFLPNMFYSLACFEIFIG